MQWDESPQAGFSNGESWLPVHPDYVFRNVENQKDDPDSLFNFYRTLIRLRKEHPALLEGIYMPLTFEPQSLMAYLRQTQDEMILVALNFSRRPLRLFLGSELAGRNWNLLLSSKRKSMEPLKGNALRLLGNEALVVRVGE